MTDDTDKQLEVDAAEEVVKLGWKNKALICGTVASLCGPMIKAHEGDLLRSYRDIGGKWTACEGVLGALPNHLYSPSECERMDAAALHDKVQAVVDLISYPVKPLLIASEVDFAYNVGMGNYRVSSVLRLTNAGKLGAACDAMLKFVCFRVQPGKGDAAGDCKTADKHLKFSQGLKNRRLDERKACKEGI